MTLYICRTNLYNQACMATLFSGLTLAILLGFAKRVDKKANLFLSLALVVIVLETGRLTSIFIPALGPLLYLYIRQLTYPERQFIRKDMLYFCPLLMAGWMPAWQVLSSTIIYLYLSRRLIEDFYGRLQLVMMDRPRVAFRRLDKALHLLSWCCMLSMFSATFYLAVVIVLIGIAVEVMLKPGSNVELTTPIADKSDAKVKGRRLKEIVAANRLYEDAELTLASLAAKLTIHPHELSRIINTGLDKNFSDFISEFRVREVVLKMHDPACDQLTLLAIAYESGFNSKTTFNRVFKEMTGKTPVEYKNMLKKEVPIDKLAPWSRIRPVLLRSESQPTWGPETSKRNNMIRLYLKIAYRQLRKEKMYAAIKIGGLALSIAACLLIGLYIHDEMNYDRMYPDADRIYRLCGDGKVDRGLAWPAPMSKAIQNDFPEVAYAGRIRPVNSYVGQAELRRADQVQNTYEQGIIYADQSFLDALQLPMVSGDGRTALKEPLTMVISKTMADKYYHGQDPIGQVMYLDSDKSRPYRIGAVMADIPANSHLHPFNIFITLTGMEFGEKEQDDWTWFNYIQYIKLKAGTDVVAFEKKLNVDIRKNYLLSQFRRGGVKDPENEVKKVSFHLQPVKDINLHSQEFSDGVTNGDIRFIWLFGAIAIFILAIACINFINLSTAKSASRAKEVGLRKVVGSYRSSLIMQFLTESLIYSLISFILGIVIAWLLLPFFNTIALKSLIMPWLEWWFVPVFLASSIIVGVLAGLYPAFYLSGFQPVKVLKGSISVGSKRNVLRNGLVVFQFATSIILIIGTIVIYSQMHFIMNHRVGFDKDQVIVLHGTNTLGYQNIKNFKTALTQIAPVKSVSISDYLPINGTLRNENTFVREGREKIDPGVGAQFWQVDEDYLKSLDIKLVEGRNFSYDMPGDTTGESVIINQAMVQKLGLKNPVGTRISNGGVLTVIGVVQDFNFESLRSNISPLVLHFGFSSSMMLVKFNGANVQNTVAEVSALWEKFSPDQPIRYTFLDQEFAHMYADVMHVGIILTSFAILAIIIACLGLFALSAFMAEQRSKEIGIRKVLGASVRNITTLLSGDFVKLVLVSILIASPIAWWAMNRWLQDFAYRTHLSWWIFVVSGFIAILIALITVSFQSVKAALTDPVKSLKTE
ncbi:putative ABC transport system permease protein [Chitinophaga sancti]|nr:putative ABC transport system permease protein [Chitinophaga sancti]